MARTRKIASRVPRESSASQSQVPPEDSDASGRYSWIDNVVRYSNSVVSEDDIAAYLASLLEDWFYMYNYCLTKLGVQIPFSTFQIRVLNRDFFKKEKTSWVTLKNVCERRIFTPYTDTYKRKDVSFRYAFGGRDKPDFPKKPTNSEQPKKQQRTDGAGGSSTVAIPQGTSFLVPFVWDEHFVFSRGEVRGVMNHLLYSTKDNPFLKEQSPLGITRLTSSRDLQIASTTLHMEKAFLLTFQKTVAELDVVQKVLKNEKYFKALANKEKNALEKSNADLKLQIKDAEDSNMEANAETGKAKID
ncbi:hypothetical protein SESBI_07924 [Sesbania bispinosa]|nr:hypothetical protein SESBI_07924 [Sesbania bispinosa]